MTKQKKLALVVPNLEHGGGVSTVAKFLVDVILNRSDYELTLVSLCMASRDGTSVSLLDPASWLRGITVREGVWKSIPFKHVGARFSELEFQRYKPRKALTQILSGSDLIQVVCGSPAWANAVVGLGKPVALQVATRARIERRLRDRNPRSVKALWRKLMTEMTDRLDDKALTRVDAIQVENAWMLEYARKINSGRKVDVRYVLPGVDIARFHPCGQRKLSPKQYILSVSRLDDPRKNIGLLLDAYARLPRQLREITDLVLAGSSAPPESFWNRANDYGLRSQIRYVRRPDTDELVALYQNASVFALSSDEEGLGMVILEAMACGIPVVSTRSGGPDGIIDGGENGFLTPLGDADEMAKCLCVLLEDRDRNMEFGRRARMTAKTNFSLESTGDAFLDIWENMLECAES